VRRVVVSRDVEGCLDDVLLLLQRDRLEAVARDSDERQALSTPICSNLCIEGSKIFLLSSYYVMAVATITQNELTEANTGISASNAIGFSSVELKEPILPEPVLEKSPRKLLHYHMHSCKCIFSWVQWCSWLSRAPHTRKVPGSNPG
jgi:hypothetical protein